MSQNETSSTGTFLVIEGTDGSGKGTQFQKLADRLKHEGYDVACFDFPRYDEDSSYFVRQYLNGKYGTADEVGPYTASMFYALDRYETAPAIRQALSEGKIVLANRFTGSCRSGPEGHLARQVGPTDRPAEPASAVRLMPTYRWPGAC